MKKLHKPHALHSDATLGLIAPGFAVERSQVEAGAGQLRDLGFRVTMRPDLFDRSGYLAGDDARRSVEVMRSIRDPKVDALFCARGGYGTTRILESLDSDVVRAAAKPLMGYSDVTALLLWQHRQARLVGFHAPMFDNTAGLDPEELDALRDALTGLGGEVVWSGEGITPGCTEGPLIGGSLTMLAGSLGTSWEIETDGAVLLFEEIDEKPYAVDRMIGQLGAAGKLRRLVGVGVGHLVGCFDSKNKAPDVRAVIRDALSPLGIPVVFGLPFGHAKPNFPWPMGVLARIDGGRGELRILEPGVV